MKQSLMFIPTMRHDPSETDAMSFNMLLRAGYVRQSGKGIFSYLPLAKRVLSKIEKMIRDEMEQLEAMEIVLPTLQPKHLFEQSNKQIHFKINDRNDEMFVLSNKHEQFVLQLVSDEIQSYKRLPIIFYQLGISYQDVEGIRLGLLSSREFLKKEAYSFHATNENLTNHYERIYECYTNILHRLRVPFKTVISNKDDENAAIAHDFVVLTDLGDETIAFSNESVYAANYKIVPVITEYEPSDEAIKDTEKIQTINVKTINDVCEFFNVIQSKCIKSLVYKADEQVIVALVRGDHQLSESKLKQLLQVDSLQLADEQTINKIMNCSTGSIGPMKLPFDIKVIADNAVQVMRNAIAGANEDDYHYINVNPEKDFAVNVYGDIRCIQEGEPAPDGVGTIELKNGIMIAQIEKCAINEVDASYQDELGETKPILMGSYCINITRLFQVIADQNVDDKGFAWSTQLAPFDIHLMAINGNDEIQSELAEQLYNILKSYRYDVLYDDRDERAGVKFNDSDLIGLPIRVIIGKKAEEGIVEVKVRKTGETYECAKEELIDRLNEFFRIN